MGRRNLKDKNTRKLLTNGGGTTIVSIPKEHITALKWRSKQKVTVRRVGQKLIIEDWQP